MISAEPEVASILVVDDRASNIHPVSALLQQHGYQVFPALSGRQALDRIERALPDLVLLDMRMPEMDGFEVCALLKSNDRTATIPVIFLTASSEREAVARAFAAGAVDYVTKPFVGEELLARVRTHVDLKRMRDHLLRLANERADLTQIVAHDLKNPLTSIMLAADGRGVAPDSEIAGNLATIRQCVDRCISFIDQYLGRWALAEQVQIPELLPTLLGPVLDAACAEMRPKAEACGMTLKLTIVDDPEITANAMVLRQIVDNLLSNAVKYGAADSEIEVVCAVGRSGMLRLTVADRGPGIPPDQIQHLFKRYVRLAGAISVAHSSGIGLAMSKVQAERMGAHLWYESRDGGGALFSLALPLAQSRV
jgi:two-component system sensor histidine kinase/response regulator